MIKITHIVKRVDMNTGFAGAHVAYCTNEHDATQIVRAMAEQDERDAGEVVSIYVWVPAVEGVEVRHAS